MNIGNSKEEPWSFLNPLVLPLKALNWLKIKILINLGLIHDIKQLNKWRTNTKNKLKDWTELDKHNK